MADVEVTDTTCAPLRDQTSGCAVYVWGADPTFERVTIARAAASGGWSSDTAEGVGLFLAHTDAILRNVTIADNVATARNSGGVGLAVLGGAPELTNVIVAGNVARGGEETSGVGVSTEDATTATFTNVTVTGNTAEVTSVAYGAGWANLDDGTPTLTNVTLSGNLEVSTSTWGGGLYEQGGGHVGFRHGNLWGHSAEAANMADPIGTDGNLGVDPRFPDTTPATALDWDLRLLPTSPLVDAGDPTLLDADGSPSDIGAFGGPGGGAW